MRGNQKKEAEKAAKKIGEKFTEKHGETFSKISKSALGQQMLPKNILGLSDSMVEGLYGQAYRLYNTGKYKDAGQLFRLLVMIDSTDAKYSMGLAACMHMMKEYQNAVSAYTLCSMIDPESPIPHYHVSDCYIQLKDNLSAIISLEMAVKRAGNKSEYQSLKDRASMTIESLKKDIKLGMKKPKTKKVKNKKKK